VQVATLLAVIVYFARDLYDIARGFLSGLWERKPFEGNEARLGWYLILATIPASVIGLLIKSQIEKAFSSPLAVSFFLLVTAGLLIIAERAGKRTRTMEHLTWLDALWIGGFQVLALFPGVSRSGSTITGGMLRDLDRTSAARFSFLMAVPVMLAAGLVATLDLVAVPNFVSLLPTYLWGFLSAAVVGYLAIRWLLRYLTNHPLYIFSIYCSGLAILTLIVYAIRLS
jgi:undecaprenyl-diphosphatase